MLVCFLRKATSSPKLAACTPDMDEAAVMMTIVKVTRVSFMRKAFVSTGGLSSVV
jgi:hypothetical protein